MATENELKLVRQVREKYAENPNYLPSPEEWEAIAVAANEAVAWVAQVESARWHLIHASNTVTPRGRPSILNIQHRSVQQQIRLHEAELAKAQQENLTGLELDRIFDRCGLGGHVVSAGVVWCCLAELQEERIDEQMQWLNEMLPIVEALQNLNHKRPQPED